MAIFENQSGKKIIKNAPEGSKGIVIGIDKSGCNGYSYKLDFAISKDVENYDIVERDDVKIFIDPKASMFLLGSEMDFSTDKLSSRFTFNNPNEKIRCKLSFGFDPGHSKMVARASVTDHEVFFMSDAEVYDVNEVGLYLKGQEHDDSGVYDQEWICSYDEEIKEELIDMEMTRSDLLDGM